MQKYYSATQVECYLQTPDAWRAAYLCRRRLPPSIGKIIGADVHRLLAAYLLGDTDISPPGPPSKKWGKTWYPHAIASPGLRYLPEPGVVDIEVEVRRKFDINGFSVVCIKDVEAPGLIIDHKTWDFSPVIDDLAFDVQVALYAAEHIYRTGRDKVTARWVYYALDGSASHVVEQAVSLDDITSTLTIVEQAIRDMEDERCQFQNI